MLFTVKFLGGVRKPPELILRLFLLVCFSTQNNIWFHFTLINTIQKILGKYLKFKCECCISLGPGRPACLVKSIFSGVKIITLNDKSWIEKGSGQGVQRTWIELTLEHQQSTRHHKKGHFLRTPVACPKLCDKTFPRWPCSHWSKSILIVTLN